ncbi:hypothetical protein HDU87_008859 [Geranomyces variabilis]|uniref:ERT1/acuK family PAS domain-containing protein n=1 Tax=Geranomyces variabilis TaxID=109894 RepID=A0AAD5TCH8_9FUNG|nr:hypothetical protein HDU87_008859 [Geranomyces variabilis]
MTGSTRPASATPSARASPVDRPPVPMLRRLPTTQGKNGIAAVADPRVFLPRANPTQSSVTSTNSSSSSSTHIKREKADHDATTPAPTTTATATTTRPKARSDPRPRPPRSSPPQNVPSDSSSSSGLTPPPDLSPPHADLLTFPLAASATTLPEALDSHGPQNAFSEELMAFGSASLGQEDLGMDTVFATDPFLGYDSEFSLTAPAFALPFASESMGDECAIISDFLASWDGNSDVSFDTTASSSESVTHISPSLLLSPGPISPSPLKLSSNEKFYLTAADPKDGSCEDRLRQITAAKMEAGLLKPYNYVNGYTALQKWMDGHMSPPSRQRILNVLSTFRPTFRHIAQSLTDYDLVMVEEAFERLLLEYDRVLIAMGMPQCLWRRDGRIYKANKEFAQLVKLPVEQLRDGKTSIYELMTEESAVNYWEKYGDVAFDPGQKAVLTSCVLVDPATTTTTAVAQNGDVAKPGSSASPEQRPCCFSFTIRRDEYNIPLLIAGNFLLA